MSNKQLNFVLNLVVYPFDIMISLGETDTQLRKSLHKYFWEEKSRKEVEADMCGIGSTTQGRTLMTSCNRTIIRLIDYPKTPIHFGYLAHEIFHAVTFILDRLGVKFELMKSDEAYSYLIQYVTTEVYKRIK